MNIFAQIFAMLASAVHVLFFLMESVLFGRRAVHRGVFRVLAEDLPAVRQWAFNVGFYNLFLAAGPIAGVTALHAGAEDAGRALVLYGCAFMFLAGAALVLSDLLGMGRTKGSGLPGALLQSVPPLIAILALSL